MTTPTSTRESDLRDADLEPLLLAFYDTLSRDELLASYFEELDMREHMPRIVAFWSTLLFHTRSYSGNAFRPHLQMLGLTPPHFARWVATLESTVDARFAGPAASTMKELAHRIAFSMQMRLGLAPFEPYKELSPELVMRSAR
ncbi:MAG: group III truncated hemoglobin [Gemmatimonadaceae bacterium]|nr:group III truncated hemoglobin [Gemmatimonadaceae bacterium]